MSTVYLPEKKYVASIDVHAQYTFTPECPDELPVPHGTEIVPELNAQAKFAAYRIGSKEAHNPNADWLATKEKPMLTPIEGENVDVRWPAHSIVGTKGFSLIEGLPEISDYDYYVWEGIELDMHPYGICYHDHAEKLSTGVIEFLRSKNVNTIIVGGLATDYCVKVSSIQLAKVGFKVIVNLGASRGLDEKTVLQAIDEMREAGIEFINSASDLKQEK